MARSTSSAALGVWASCQPLAQEFLHRRRTSEPGQLADQFFAFGGRQRT